MSSGAAVQLYDFCVGERLPPEVVRLAYKEAHQPTAETRAAVDATEVALVELSSPIEQLIDDKIVNLNNIHHLIANKLRSSRIDPKLVVGWGNALSNAKDDLKERSQALLMNWPDDLEDDGLARFGVENLSSRRLSVDDMVRDLERLRDRLRKPMVLQLYQFRYMPDGRVIEWPAGFKAEQIEVARRLDLPTFDLAPVVSQLGTKRLITDDMYHWRAETRPLQAKLTYDFLAQTLDRPSLETYPESRGIRHSVRVAFPEFAGEPVPDAPPPASAEGAPIGEPGWPTATDSLTDRLNRQLVEFHRLRLENIDLEGNGLYARYQRLLDLGTLVGFREEGVLEIIDSELPAYDTYAVMRSGLGELALLIAASGRKVIVFEPTRHGRSAIEEGAAHLTSVGMLAPGALNVVAALTPERLLEGRVLGIGLRAGYLPSQADAAAHLARTAHFDALLIDPGRFICRRQDPADQKALAKSLGTMGFDGRTDYQDDVSWFRRSGRAARVSREANTR